jgi:hypothetical protein
MGAGVVIGAGVAIGVAMGSFFMSEEGIVVVDGLPLTIESAAGVGLRIVRLDPVPVPGVCSPVAELGAPSDDGFCSGFGLVVEFIIPGVEGGVFSGTVCAPARPVAMRSAAAMAVL